MLSCCLSVFSSCLPRRSRYVLTDRVPGPFKDLDNGPFTDLMVKAQSHKSKVEIIMHDGNVNALCMQDVAKTYQPDLIVGFGTWRNVLTDDICDECNTSHEARPSVENASNKVQKPQYSVFDDGPELLITMARALMAQSDTASVLQIGPMKYMWRVCAMNDRPMLKFRVRIDKEIIDDYYQGSEKHYCADWIGMYWPADASKIDQLCYEKDGTINVHQLMDLHKNVLIISAGRGRFWAQFIDSIWSWTTCDVIKALASQCSQCCRASIREGIAKLVYYQVCRPSWCKPRPLEEQWARFTAIDSRDSFNSKTKCKVECMAQRPYMCRKCLRQAKNWSGVPDKKFRVWETNNGVQTDALEWDQCYMENYF